MELLVKSRRVYCDCDGVLAHFDRHLHDLFGVYPSELPDDDMHELIRATPEFWPTIPMKHGAKELWEMIQPYNPVILTGCPKLDYENAAAHKVVWAKQQFGEDVKIITCLSRNKPLHMESKGDILIDDMSRNCRRWEEAGGLFVHYRKFDQAVVDFKALIESLGADV